MGMKIHNIKRLESKAVRSNGKRTRAGGFQSLLKSRLETIQSVQKAKDLRNYESDTPKAWELIESATQLLDKAMEQIQKNGCPDTEVVNALRELHAKLHRNAGLDGNAKEADTIIAVETSRLQAWKHLG